MKELNNKFRNGLKWTSVSSLFNILFQIFQTGAIAFFLSNKEIGLYSLLITSVGFIQIFNDIGVSNAIIHFQNMSFNQYNTLYWLNVFIGIILTFLSLIVSSIFISLNINTELFLLLRVASVTFFIQSLGQQYQYFFQKEMFFQKIATINVIVKTISLFSLLILLYFGYKLDSIVYSLVLSTTIYSCMYIYYGQKFYFPKITRNISLNECKDMINFGFFQLLERLLNYSSSNFDRYLISYFYGLNILGPYELAMQIVNKPYGLINSIFNTVAFPVYSKLQNAHDELNKMYITNVQILSFIVCPIYVGLYVTSNLYLPLIFPNNHAEIYPIFNLVWWLGIFYSIGNPLGSYLLALGKVKVGFYMNIIKFLTMLFFLIIGGLYFSFNVMILLYSFGSILIMLPIDFYIRKYLTNMNNIEFSANIIRNLLSSIIMGVLVYFLLYILNIKYELVFSILCGGLVYFLMSYFLNRNLLLNLIKSIN